MEGAEAMKHADQVLALLEKQIQNEEEVRDISKTAKEVVSKSVNPYHRCRPANDKPLLRNATGQAAHCGLFSMLSTGLSLLARRS
jgi:hypothetical protein